MQRCIAVQIPQVSKVIVIDLRFDSGAVDEYKGKDAKQIYEELLMGCL